MMGEMSQPFTPCTSSEFKQHLDSYDGSTYREKIGSAVDTVWPAPDYREHQRETVIETIEKLYIEDNDVLLLSAPTGAGKSLLLYTAVAVVDEVTNRKSFSTTPLNTLVDQVDNDDFLDDVITIKGRSHYSCVHPEDRGTSVDNAICQRRDDFECQYKDQHHEHGGCPYYGRKYVAQNKAKLFTNLSFLMTNSMIPDVVDAGFDKRELLCVDECQSVDDFALLFVGVTISKRNIPISWNRLSFPSDNAEQDDVIEWLERDVLKLVVERIEELESRKESFMFTEKEQDQLEDLRRFNQKAGNLLSDIQDNHWAMNVDTFGGNQKIHFEPIHVGRFMDKYLWSQSHKIICASATIPPNFVEEVGLDDRNIARIDVESTFPPERRPVITTEDVGKMTHKQRDQTIPKMADQIGRIANLWEGHKGIVHANSYKIAERLYDRLPTDVKQRSRLQDGDNREQSLQDWVDANVNETGQYTDEGGQLFISVAQEEGISLDDEQARFNIISKASFPHMKDERVAYRMDADTMGGKEWDWYMSRASIDLQQACGRTTRSKEDWSATYVLDSSAVQLIERNKHLLEDWFVDAVNCGSSENYEVIEDLRSSSDCDFDESVVSPDNGGIESDDRDESDDSPDGYDTTSMHDEQTDLDDIADKYFG